MSLKETLEKLGDDFKSNVIRLLEENIKEVCNKYPIIENLEIPIYYNFFDDTTNYNSIETNSITINFISKEQFIKSTGKAGTLYLKSQSILEDHSYLYVFEENEESKLEKIKVEKEISDIKEEIDNIANKENMLSVVEMFEDISSILDVFAKQYLVKDVICMHFSANNNITYNKENNSLI
jgi:hypothetical protein